jgi:phospholipid transport system transporter-binding protein
MTEACALKVGSDGAARLTGELTFETVARLHREMEQSLAGTGPIELVDLSGVPMADSAGLALMLEWQARQRKRGRELTIINAPDNLMHLAKLSEAVDLLNLSGRGTQE